MKKLILQTKDKIGVHILVPSAHDFYSYSDARVEKVEKGKIMKLLDCISELISNIDLPEV